VKGQAICPFRKIPEINNPSTAIAIASTAFANVFKKLLYLITEGRKFI